MRINHDNHQFSEWLREIYLPSFICFLRIHSGKEGYVVVVGNTLDKDESRLLDLEALKVYEDFYNSITLTLIDNF